MPALQAHRVIAPEGVVVFVIGVDSHKSSLAICVVDELGRSIGARTVANSAKGHAVAYAWVCERLSTSSWCETSHSCGSIDQPFELPVGRHPSPITFTHLIGRADGRTAIRE